MKNIVYCLMMVFLFMSCSYKNMINTNENTDEQVLDTIVVIEYDTIMVVDTAKLDSLAKCLDSLAKCLESTQDSLVFYRDSIRYDDYINARRIEKIKYYIKICENNSKNKQFFFGWIRRTMTE